MFYEPKEGTAGQGWGLLTSIATKGSPWVSYQTTVIFCAVAVYFQKHVIEQDNDNSNSICAVDKQELCHVIVFNQEELFDWVQTISQNISALLMTMKEKEKKH